MKVLKILNSTMKDVLASAKRANGFECLGLLASQKKSDVITEAPLFPSAASAAHAEAAPMAIKRLADALKTDGMIPRGIWHSHGDLDVFHSATDHGTMNRFLPAMAQWNFERPRPPILAPSIIDSDSAVLPQLDSQNLCFTLKGSTIPGMEAQERVHWENIKIRFTKIHKKPRAILEADRLILEGGYVIMTLDLPEGSTIACSKEDHAPMRVATVYSLVVNVRGGECAECLVIHDLNGEYITQNEVCNIQRVEENDGKI